MYKKCLTSPWIILTFTTESSTKKWWHKEWQGSWWVVHFPTVPPWKPTVSWLYRSKDEISKLSMSRKTFRFELLYKNKFPLDGQTRWRKSISQLVKFSQYPAFNETTDFNSLYHTCIISPHSTMGHMRPHLIRQQLLNLTLLARTGLGGDHVKEIRYECAALEPTD